jgi:hypothetical protein
MPCQYADPGNLATTATTLKTAVLVGSIAGLRPSVFEFSLGADGAPNATDCSIVGVLQLWTTSAGTTTAVTPTPLDPGYQAAKASAGSNATGEPTYTAGSIPWGPMGINQRATYRWVAAPNGLITLVGTATTGIGMQVKSTNYASQTDCTIFHQE